MNSYLQSSCSAKSVLMIVLSLVLFFVLMTVFFLL